MNKELSKPELLSGVKVLQAVELGSQLLHKAEHGARPGVTLEYLQTMSLDGITIARAEMARYRRGLGTLTHRQEVAIENLLLSTVNRISELGRELELFIG